jgi:inositol polyphosphate 5-phosphatase INPP5B/F
MTANSLINEETKRCEEWDTELHNLFSTLKEKYDKLISKQLVGLYSIVYINTKLKDEVKDLNIETITRGLLGIGGNKGAISIRFK